MFIKYVQFLLALLAAHPLFPLFSFSLQFYICGTTQSASQRVLMPCLIFPDLIFRSQRAGYGAMADVVQARCNRLCFFFGLPVLKSTANPISCDRHAQLKLIPA